ncbi:stage III sporulation protein AB [Pelagirhabdus alkalitolerans]|uniref:Stage III sporulation protein AB n=1 Tax=Pelagirhabdus alkalitolerans TaxID=1612202 RepID=A0A1G6I0L5_9BACI|nr:stage III sporulation protein AB [Pelagirhabdus alkalitolerans]SDB99923.1 stage III sporulation protein AB [Pelagirhabdus alkalitolerans]
MNGIGALLIVSASTLIGYYLSVQFTQRIKQITTLKAAIQLLEAEMVYSQRDLQSIFCDLSKRIEGAIGLFFEKIAAKMNEINDLPTLWSEESERIKYYSALKQNEVDILKQFGQTLGHYNIEQQKKQIQLTLIHIDRALTQIDQNRTDKSRLYQVIGFLTGVFIVLVLI